MLPFALSHSTRHLCAWRGPRELPIHLQLVQILVEATPWVPASDELLLSLRETAIPDPDMTQCIDLGELPNGIVSQGGREHEVLVSSLGERPAVPHPVQGERTY